MNGPAIAPEQTHALIVGLESYPKRKGLDLTGPAPDARAFARWLIRERGVPAHHLTLLLSSQTEEKGPDLQGVHQVHGVITQEVVQHALEKLRQTGSQLLLVFWTGHGIMTADRIRRPLFANYSDTDNHNLNVDSLQEHLRSAGFAYPPCQILLFDMCATLFDERVRRESLIDHKFQSGPARLDCQQFLLYAAADRQAAENLAAEQTGLYFRELLPILQRQPAWPPNMQQVVAELDKRFAELRAQNQTAQEPIHQFWRAPTGKSEANYLGAPAHGPAAGFFQARYATLLVLCAAASLPLFDFVLFLAPPWPDHEVVVFAIVPAPFLVYLGSGQLLRGKTTSQLEKALKYALAAVGSVLVLYLFLFVLFTHPLPDHRHREVGGFILTSQAKDYLERNPGTSIRALLADSGNDVNEVFENTSINLMRALLLLCWFFLAVSGSLGITIFLLLQR